MESMITLLHGDCLDLMRDIPDGSVDAIIADLPYGTTACKWDTVIPFEPLWAHYKRIIKRNGAIVLFGSQPFTSALVMSNPQMFKYEWIWDKDKSCNFACSQLMPLRYHENILIFYTQQPTYNPQMWDAGKPGNKPGLPLTGSAQIYGRAKPFEIRYSGRTTRYPRSIIPINTAKHNDSQNGSLHPTQKPVALLEYLIRTYTNEGEMVLDNTMGSGTTGVACVNTGRRFIGIEKDAGYFQIAQKRIQDAQGKARQLDFTSAA